MADPWIKFYPQDWSGDEELSMCSLSARGLLAACLHLMHKAEPYGHLLLHGVPPSDSDLAKFARCTAREVRLGMEELIRKGAVSVTADNVVYSRRMVRDQARRLARHENGKLGGNPLLKLFPQKEVNHSLSTHITPIASGTGSLVSGISELEKNEPLDALLDRFLREHYPPEGYQAGWEVDQAWGAVFAGVDQAAQYAELCEAVAQHRRSVQWREGKIPSALRWLKEKRWRQRLREPDAAQPSGELAEAILARRKRQS